MARMRNSHFLFLGYGMRDWNLRVILHHIWSQQVRKMGSWAIERDPDPIDASSGRATTSGPSRRSLRTGSTR